MSNWKPRLRPDGVEPTSISDYYSLASDVEVYGDSGICRHLPYLREIASGKRVVELGMGGGDQSTLAWIDGKAKSLQSYDINTPASLDTVRRLASESGVEFEFYHGNTATSPVFECDILFVDTLHDANTVEIELARFAANCKERIIFHDVVAFGRVGQFSGPNEGINLAIAEFLFTHTGWVVDRFVDYDNGLLTLRRAA